MSANFNIKTIDDNGALIRVLANNKLVHCTFPKEMPANQRMGFMKHTANEILLNSGLPGLVQEVKYAMINIGSDEEPNFVYTYHEDNNLYNLPDVDPEATEHVSEETKQLSWWDKIKGWFA